MENSIFLNQITPSTLLLAQEKIFEKNWIHIILCVQEKVIYKFGPVYTRELLPNKAFIIYDPDKDLPFELEMQGDSLLYILKMSLNTLHKMFAPESDHAPIFNPENANRKFYEEREISTDIIAILHQLREVKLTDNALRLYYQAKSIEILSLFFSKNKTDLETCPFLNDEHIVRKIKNAKTLLIQNYAHPDTLPAIAKQVGLNDFQLKLGFKEIYGNTPYQFLLDYKLELARQMLINHKLQVNEVADKIGYTNVSHFITAFKRKYGMTPKKIT